MRKLSREQLQRLWRQVRPWATLGMSAAIVAALGAYVARHWSVVVQYHWQALAWPWLGLAVLCMSGFFLGNATAWRDNVSLAGTTIPWAESLWAWSRSSLARYLPTPVWAAGSRLYVTMQFGASWRGGTFGYVAELAGSITAALCLALLVLPQWVTGLSPLGALGLAAIAALGAAPLAYGVVVRVLDRVFCPMQRALPPLFRLAGLYAASALCYGAAHLCGLKGLGLALPPIGHVLGVSALAWALGTLNVFSPSGLGTRELVLMYGLQNYLSPPELLAFSASMRLLAVAGEFIFFAGSYGLKAVMGSPSMAFSRMIRRRIR